MIKAERGGPQHILSSLVGKVIIPNHSLKIRNLDTAWKFPRRSVEELTTDIRRVRS